MKFPVNLASQPFRKDRPVLVGSVVLSVVLMGLLGALIWLASTQSGQVAEAGKDIAKLERQLRRTEADQAREEATLREPANAEVLERSLFLNALLYRKGISWTRILADLEKTVPNNVRLISIRPSVNGRNEITLDMMVGAQTQAPVIEMLKALEGSEVFHSVQLHTGLPPSQTEPLWRYRVSVNYAQKL